jgi:hypothetical protein
MASVKTRHARQRLGRCGWILLIGAIVNVGVAWACSLSADPHAPSKVQSAMQIESATIVKSARSSFGCETTIFERTRVNMPGRISRSKPGMPATIERKRWTVHQSGWPMRALSGGRRVNDVSPDDASQSSNANASPANASALTESRGRFSVPVRPTQAATSDPWTFRVLPMKPMWGGFAVNTLAYAAALWVLLAIPSSLRRMRRTRRALCPVCAYPVGTSDICSERGASLANKTKPSVAEQSADNEADL